MNVKSVKVLVLAALFSTFAVSMAASADEDLATLVGKGLKGAWHGIKKLDKKAVQATIVVKDGIVYGTDKAYSAAIKPFIVAPVVELARLTVVDGVYKVALEPIGKGAEALAKNDVVTGAQVYGQNVSANSQTLAADTSKDANAVYKVVLTPIGHTAVRAGHGVVYIACEAANPYRATPKSCSSSKVTATMEAE